MKCGHCGKLQGDADDRTINVCESCDADGWTLVGAGQVVRKDPRQFAAGGFRAKRAKPAAKPAPAAKKTKRVPPTRKR